MVYTNAQYRAFVDVTNLLLCHHTIIPVRIIGYSDIAPERKTDPESSFSCRDFRQFMSTQADDI